MDSTALLSHALAMAASVRRFAAARRAAIVSVAIVCFTLFFAVSIVRLELRFSEIGWGWLGLAAAVMPFALLMNAQELVLCARGTANGLSIPKALAYSSAATLANVLPIPAGMALRAKALVDTGMGWTQGGVMLLAAGMLWFAMALVSVGLALLPGSVGLTCLAVGTLASIVITGWIAHRISLRTGIGFLVVRAIMLLLIAVRIQLCFLAIGQSISLKESAIFTLAGVVGNGVMIVPSGIGIAEGVGAALADLVGKMPAAAFLALAVNRLLGLAGSAIVMGCFHGFSRPTRATGALEAR